MLSTQSPIVYNAAWLSSLEPAEQARIIKALRPEEQEAFLADWRHWVNLPDPHDEQRRFIESTAKRKVIRAGRRGGKTVGVSILAVNAFAGHHRRVLYATPTQEQIDRFWFEVKRALAEALDQERIVKNETRHLIECPGTENRIRAKTAWNADTLRGDYADLLILDEWQLMNEQAWEVVGAPMLADNNGDAVFVYTPPSIRSRSTTKARDPLHAAKLFKRAQQDPSGRWETFHFSSMANPYLSREGLEEIAQDMTRFAYEQEILAIDKEDNPAALWKRQEMIEALRVSRAPELARVVVAVDPATSSNEASNETGIIIAGVSANGHGYVLADRSLRASPHSWASVTVTAYDEFEADRVVAEINQGGQMVEQTIRTVDKRVSYKGIHASRGKQVRAEPVAALYEQGKVHHVGTLADLEDQLCQWTPGDDSPDRLDALVWAITELMLGKERKLAGTIEWD
jgi:phage terminase large subunit-like protein